MLVLFANTTSAELNDREGACLNNNRNDVRMTTKDESSDDHILPKMPYPVYESPFVL